MIQLNLQTQKFSLLLLLIVLKLSIDLTQTGSMGELRLNDLAVANSDDEYQQRRDFDLKKLRHFLLTSNAEERAYRREQQAALKRDLVGPDAFSNQFFSRTKREICSDLSKDP